MTLIACTLNYKKPFIIGDLLVSSTDADKSIQLPSNTIDINKFLKPKSSHAVGLYQKIYIINNNVCVALAGNVYEMTEFLKEFTRRCAYYDNITEQDIHSFIEEYDKENLFANSAFYIMLMFREGTQITVRQFWYPPEHWNTVKSEIFEEVSACGSGKDDFLYQAAEKQHFSDATFEKGNIHRAVAFNLSLIAKFLAIERVSLHTINKNWGGGFETILFDGSKFIKLDQVAYVACYAQFDSAGNIGLPQPQLIIYYEYYKDVLFMSSIEVKRWNVEETGDSIILTSNHYSADLHMAPRLDLPAGSVIELPPHFSFQTRRVALGYTLITPGNVILAPASFLEDNGVSVQYEDKQFIRLVLKRQINDLIAKTAKEVFPNL